MRPEPYFPTAEFASGRAIERGRRFAGALADIEPWLVSPFLALGLIMPRGLGAALLVPAGFWLVRWVAWKQPTVRTAGDGPIAVLILMVPITLSVTTRPGVTREQVLWLAAGIALYYTIVNWMRTAARERALVLCVVGAGLFAALVAPVVVEWVTAIKLTFIPASLYERLPLLAAVPLNPNVLGGMLALLLPVPLALLMFDAQRLGPRLQRHERVASAAAVLGLAAILVLTKSRGALLAAGVAALVLCLLRWRRSWVVMVLIALLAWFALWQVGFAQMTDLLTKTGSLVGFSNRFEMWSRGVYLVRDFPLTGIGMGTFEPLAKARYPFILLGPNADVPHAHNLFLQVAVDLGIPGLVAWLGLLFLAARNAWRVHLAGVHLTGVHLAGVRRSGSRLAGRRQGLGWAAGLGAGLLCSQVALVIHGMVDAAVWGAHSALVVWVLWGICAAAYNLRYTFKHN